MKSALEIDSGRHRTCTRTRALPLAVSTTVICALIAACVITPRANAQTPADDGQWEPPFSLPLIAIHSAVLPTGKVLLFSAEHGVPGIHGWLLEPNTLALAEVAPPAGWNPDCSGHSFLPDGRLLVAGGTLQFNPLLGSKLAFIFNSYTEQWLQIADMARGRWYPTNITLGDGRVMTMSGLNDSDGELNPDIEMWDPSAPTSWALVDQRTVPYYPYLHLLPNGLVFRSGPDPQTETFDPSTAQWAPVAATNFAGRYEAPSVLLPPSLDRVMLIGGTSGSGAPTNSAEIIDFADTVPQWTTTAHMQFQRMEHDAVILPDATVLVLGGRSNQAGPDVPVLIPERFDPVTESWEQLAPHQTPRMYHSTAILLPDARVLLAGGDFQPSGEIYSPPYLFAGSRPVIQSAPTEIGYGSTFPVGFSSTTASNTIALVKTSSATHSLNMGQRYVRLGQFGAGGGTVATPEPADASSAPPGNYMLFVIDENGVPSQSRMVLVRESAGQPCNGAPSCDDGNLCTRDSCDPILGCVNLPQPIDTALCLRAGKAKLQISNKDSNEADKLKWNWGRGDDGFDMLDLGTPESTTSYALCIYDTTGSVSNAAARLRVDPSPSWQNKNPKGYRYKDSGAAEDGVRTAKLKTGSASKAKVSISAKGASIPMPTPINENALFSQDPSVVAQLVNDQGTCWTSEFGAVDTTRNDVDRFKARVR